MPSSSSGSIASSSCSSMLASTARPLTVQLAGVRAPTGRWTRMVWSGSSVCRVIMEKPSRTER
ncbi:Uncharacterised protein [Bordetella pertussis]|nr:Uncharacterised protein [Bordetella pertussis]